MQRLDTRAEYDPEKQARIRENAARRLAQQEKKKPRRQYRPTPTIAPVTTPDNAGPYPSGWNRLPDEASRRTLRVKQLAFHLVMDADYRKAPAGWYRYDCQKLNDRQLIEVAEDQLWRAYGRNHSATELQLTYTARGRMADGARQYRKVHQNGPLNPTERRGGETPARHWLGQRKEKADPTHVPTYRGDLADDLRLLLVEEAELVWMADVRVRREDMTDAEVIKAWADHLEITQRAAAESMGLSLATYKRKLRVAREHYIRVMLEQGTLQQLAAGRLRPEEST